MSPFMLWRFGFVSVLFAAIVLGVFGLAQARGMSLDGARTMVVNTLVVLEIFYLFNVRHLRLGVLNWRAAMGTPAVLAALGAVVAAQFAFTYLPAMNRWFASQPLSFGEGLITVACGVGFMLVLEAEKALLRRMGWFDELSR
jgi:magnesium-transporting ATPase (P-type)